MSDWISTKHAMSLLGVGSTTIKRWADEGRIPYYKTAGGHRRFRRGAIERLAEGKEARAESAESGRVAAFIELLNADPALVTTQIRQMGESTDDWFKVADFLCEGVERIASDWSSGECSTVDANIAWTTLRQAVTSTAADIAVPNEAPVALVSPVSGDPHMPGPVMIQTCLRSIGWQAKVLGVGVLPEQLTEHLRTSHVQLMVLCASARHSDGAMLTRYARTVGRVCEEQGIRLVIAGAGAWPESLAYGYRCNTFEEMRALLERRSWLVGTH